jgi:hypothetical protein
VNSLKRVLMDDTYNHINHPESRVRVVNTYDSYSVGRGLNIGLEADYPD